MFQHQGIWLPEGEAHFPEWMTKNGELVNGKGTYQIKKLRAAMGYVTHWNTAVDVGGHVGLWAMHLAARFAQLHAFEPMEQFRACFARNVTADNVLLYPCALGANKGFVKMKYDPADSGGTHVGSGGDDTDTPMYRLDDFAFSDVDFIKLDCEGYEHLALEGARDTLMRCRPVVVVEQKPHKLGPNFGIKGTPAVDLLKHLGYVVREVISGDYILTHA